MHRTLAAFIAALGILLPGVCVSAGWTQWAIPTQVDVIVMGGYDGGPNNVMKGIMIYGAFGNPGLCSIADRIYISERHPMFSQIYAAVLAANISGKKIRGYVSSCTPNPWYATSDTTFGLVLEAVNFGN
jgi:hypothetical protein